MRKILVTLSIILLFLSMNSIPIASSANYEQYLWIAFFISKIEGKYDLTINLSLKFFNVNFPVNMTSEAFQDIQEITIRIMPYPSLHEAIFLTLQYKKSISLSIAERAKDEIMNCFNLELREVDSSIENGTATYVFKCTETPEVLKEFCKFAPKEDLGIFVDSVLEAYTGRDIYTGTDAYYWYSNGTWGLKVRACIGGDFFKPQVGQKISVQLYKDVLAFEGEPIKLSKNTWVIMDVQENSTYYGLGLIDADPPPDYSSTPGDGSRVYYWELTAGNVLPDIKATFVIGPPQQLPDNKTNKPPFEPPYLLVWLIIAAILVTAFVISALFERKQKKKELSEL